MANTINWVVVAIFSVIVLYFMVAVAMDVSNTTSSCEEVEIEANDTTTAMAQTMLLYPAPLLYNDSECADIAKNYSYTSGGFALGWDNEPGTFYGTYDYDTPTTVWDINFAFIGILIIVAVGLVIAKNTIKV